MSFWADAAELVLDLTGISAVTQSDFYQNHARPVLDEYFTGFKELNNALDTLYQRNDDIDNDDQPTTNPDTSVPDSAMDDISQALDEALKQIDTLEGMLNNQNSKTYVQIMDVYKGDTGKMIELQNAIADMQSALSKAQIQSEQAAHRLSKYEDGLRSQSVGGQRKAMKEAIKNTRDDQRTINQNIQALTTGIAKAESNLANLGRIEATTPSEVNDIYAMQVATQSGVPIAKTTTDPGRLVEISLPISTKDVTLDEE